MVNYVSLGAFLNLKQLLHYSLQLQHNKLSRKSCLCLKLIRLRHLLLKKNPDRENIKYCIEYIDNSIEIASIFSCVIEELKQKKERCSKRLVYTQTRVQCRTICNAFNAELGVFVNGVPNPKSRLVELVRC